MGMKNIEELIKLNKEIIEARKQMLKMLEVMEVEDNDLIKEEEVKIKLAELELKRLMNSE